MLLLDTHAWIWLVNGDKKIKSNRWLKKILNAAQRSELYVASITIWEVGMLESKGRLKLDRGCEDWIDSAISQPGISIVQLEPAIAVEASRLPGDFHGDPADRILIATARKKAMKLVTVDQRMKEYAAQGFVKTL